MPTERQPTEPPEDDIENFTETETDSVEMQYSGGTLTRIHVEATWREGSRSTDDDVYGEHVRNEVSAHALFTVREQRAELVGFYPETNKTGQSLYTETLKAVRVLDHCATVVRDRVDDDVRVMNVADTLQTQLGK